MGGRAGTLVAAAIWLGLLLGLWTSFLAAIPIIAIGTWLAVRRGRSPWPELALFGLLLLGSGLRAEAARRAHARLAVTPGLHRIMAVVASHPERAGGAPVAIVRVERAVPPIPRGAHLRIRLPERCHAEWGDRLEALAELDPPAPPRNPGQRDPRLAAFAANVVASGRARVARIVKPSGHAPWVVVRRAVEARLAHGLSRPAGELAVPLLVGDRSGLSSDLDAGFRASGLIHLLALSGLHVTWMAGVLRGLAAWLGLGPRARMIAGTLAAWGYVAIAGAIPSLLRAAVAETLAALARILGRGADPVQVLAIASTALLVVFPGWAHDLGFQLSVAATLGLATVGAALRQVSRRIPWADGFMATVSAQVCALPLLLNATHGLSWVAPFSNLVAVPVSGLLLAAAWMAVAADLALPGFGHPWFAASEGLALALRRVTEAAASVPGAVWVTGPQAWKAALAGAGALLLAMSAPPPRNLAAIRRGRSRARHAAIGAGIALIFTAVLAVALTRPIAPPRGRWWLVMLDVGQGEAIAIGGRSGWWLVDAGARSPLWDAGESRVVPFLRWAGLARLRGVAITHEDADHAGGALAVWRAARPERWWVPDTSAVRLPPAARARSAGRGDTLWKAPLAVVAWPPASRNRFSDNEGSLVLTVGAGAGRALLTADIDSTIERRLEVAPGVSVLKVAHHGSRSSTGATLLAAIRPRLAVVSCGRRNPFGHPAAETLERLRGAGTEIRRTDQEGALWIELSEDGAHVLDWRRNAWRRAVARP